MREGAARSASLARPAAVIPAGAGGQSGCGMGRGLRGRSAREVLCDHLRLRRLGKVDMDLARNVSPNLVLLTKWGYFWGHGGLRSCSRKLSSEFPDACFTYKELLVKGDFGFLEWSAESSIASTRDGADSYLVRDGFIVAQSIHYTIHGG
jgi:hypothetical protein